MHHTKGVFCGTTPPAYKPNLDREAEAEIETRAASSRGARRENVRRSFRLRFLVNYGFGTSPVPTAPRDTLVLTVDSLLVTCVHNGVLQLNTNFEKKQ